MDRSENPAAALPGEPAGSRGGRISASDVHWPATTEVLPAQAGILQVWCGILRCELKALGRLERLLSEDEVQRASRLRSVALRHRFVVSRSLLRIVLGRCLDTAPEDLRFGWDVGGKPHLANDRDVEFNLAHTGDLMLLALTRSMPVGVDVERVRRLNDPVGIARRFFTAREADWLQRRTRDELNRAFFRLWTRKEAVLKAGGEGISSGLESLELLDADGWFSDLVMRQHKDSAATKWSVMELHPAIGFLGALAVPGDAGRVELRTATLRLD